MALVEESACLLNPETLRLVSKGNATRPRMFRPRDVFPGNGPGHANMRNTAGHHGETS
jgi:hypothetical protein